MEVIDEIWENALNIGFSKYDVSTYGRIRNAKTQYILRLKPRPTGYVVIRLRNDNDELSSICMHIMVAKLFIPNPGKKLTVDHIDKNQSNNKINNLRWASHQEQCENKRISVNRKGRSINQYTIDGQYMKTWDSIKNASCSLNIDETSISRALSGRFKSGGGYKWKYNDNDQIGEIWKPVPIEIKNIYASNYGRIKNSNGHILSGYIQNGYIDLKLSDNKHYLVHRLICSTFNGLPPDDVRICVNHINGNKTDNRAVNLEWVSYSGNMKHAYNIGLIDKKTNSKAVLKYTLDGLYIERYNSITEASRAIDTHHKSISSAIKNNSGIYKGFLWKLENDNLRQSKFKVQLKSKYKPKLKLRLKIDS